jgi:hypothetical protein
MSHFSVGSGSNTLLVWTADFKTYRKKIKELTMLGHSIRHTLSLLLAMLMLGHLSPSSFAAENIRTQIAAAPLGTPIEVRLTNKQTLRGARGEVSDSGFTLLDSRRGGRHVAFDDIAFAKQFTKRSHPKRNILIGVGIGVGVMVVLGVVVAARGLAHYRCGNCSLLGGGHW